MSIGPPRDTGVYPFSKLDDAKATALAAGIDLIDFGVGDPKEETPAFIRHALINAVPAVSSYPKTGGLPQLQQSIAHWIQRRFGTTLDPDRQVMPTLGSKEIIHSLAAYCITDKRNVVIVPTPAYPVYERGALFHGAEVIELELRAENNFLPDLNEIPDETWSRVALLWLNYPNNPTGACAPFSYYQHVAELARHYGFIVASDEAYSEIYFGEPPASVLQLNDLTNIVAINTLSKRSCMTGYRSGFIAGDSRIIGEIKGYARSVGVTPQEFVQHASIAAWEDEEHVTSFRSLWLEKRDALQPALEAHGLHANSEATFFLWAEIPKAFTSEHLSEQLLRIGIVVSPGTFFGRSSEGFIRVALVPSLDDCKRAADRLKNWNIYD